MPSLGDLTVPKCKKTHSKYYMYIDWWNLSRDQEKSTSPKEEILKQFKCFFIWFLPVLHIEYALKKMRIFQASDGTLPIFRWRLESHIWLDSNSFFGLHTQLIIGDEGWFSIKKTSQLKWKGPKKGKNSGFLKNRKILDCETTNTTGELRKEVKVRI
jgi:hypothetical protein